mmetsp:Transcript_25428/g.72442  ORF Transcript_25428/g.72442 Transcript_25428/m.72442 type:complete len:369 (+) Transcript_25428:189-1295(+)
MGKWTAAPPPASTGLLWSSFRLGQKLGSGSFGDVFSVAHVRTGEEFAVKIERVSANRSMLMHEASVLEHLRGIPGVANVQYYFLDEGCGYDVMMMDLLGPSLGDVFKACGRKFSLKTVLMIADKMLHVVEHLHSRGFIHRDIKPDNVCIGRATSPSSSILLEAQASDIYLIDFGLSQRYCDLKTGKHVPYSEGNGFSGTLLYCSINAQEGIQQSRRDDLQALGYSLMYLVLGQLPWQSLQGGTREDTDKMLRECKSSTTVAALCSGCPEPFAVYLVYSQGLRFEDRPDYAYLRRLFRNLFVLKHFARDYLFDGPPPSEKVIRSGLLADANEDGGTEAAAEAAAPWKARPRRGQVRSLLRRLVGRRAVA